mgnify:CR=1 FL=1
MEDVRSLLALFMEVPRTALLTGFLSRTPLDRSASVVIGDRSTDLELAANLRLRGLRLDLIGHRATPGERILVDFAVFLKHLEGGILWAAGAADNAPGAETPSPEPKR